jgi:hypothetical protein
MKENNTLQQMKDVKMTQEEKSRVWDGVLRRTTDYPDGEYPFGEVSNNWDGVLRRKSDFPPLAPEEEEAV